MGRLNTVPTVTTTNVAARQLSGRRLLGLAGLVAAGGALGTLARWFLEATFSTAPGAWPWTTFWINLGGSLLLGALLEWLLRTGPDYGSRRAVRLGVGTGLIGGFTTYSTFVLETVDLAQEGRAVLAVAYALVSIVLGVAAAVVGTGLAATVSRRIARRRGGCS